jgi:hypothetical protein
MIEGKTEKDRRRMYKKEAEAGLRVCMSMYEGWWR